MDRDKASLGATGNLPFPTPRFSLIRKGPRQRTLQGLTKMLLDSVEDVHAVLAVDHVHCQAPLAKAASAPDPVQVSLVVRVPILVHRKVEVDDNRHLFNIDTCVKESWRRVRTGDKNHCHSPIQATCTNFGWRESGWASSGIQGEGAHSRTQRKTTGLWQVLT